MRPRAFGRGRFDFSVSGTTLLSMPSTASDVLVPFPGASVRTIGPTNIGQAQIWVSQYASGYSKDMTLRLKRDGVTLSSRFIGSFADRSDGGQWLTKFPVPAYPQGALYELWWQIIANGTSYSASRSIVIPTDELRLETREVSEWISSLTAFPISVPSAQDIMRIRTAGPTRGGTARLIWSINAAGVSKNPTAMRLYRDATILYSSGNLNPGDSTAGTSYDSGVVAVPPWPRPATYRWVGQYNGRAYVPSDEGNVSYYVSGGSIVVPLVRNR